MRKRFFNNEGFTLIELLMVVIILGILAAVVIPQFSSSSKDAKESVLKTNLSAIRGALELYALQHNENYPGADGDPNTFINQLTLYTDRSGNATVTKGTDNPYGPYLKNGFPKNPFVTDEDAASSVYIDTVTGDIGAVTAIADPNTTTAGWIFVYKTGEFIVNNSTYQDW